MSALNCPRLQEPKSMTVDQQNIFLNKQKNSFNKCRVKK